MKRARKNPDARALSGWRGESIQGVIGKVYTRDAAHGSYRVYFAAEGFTPSSAGEWQAIYRPSGGKAQFVAQHVASAQTAMRKADAHCGTVGVRSNPRKRNPSDVMTPERAAAIASMNAAHDRNTAASDALYLQMHGRLPPEYTEAQRRADERAVRAEWRAPAVRAPGRRNPDPKGWQAATADSASDRMKFTAAGRYLVFINARGWAWTFTGNDGTKDGKGGFRTAVAAERAADAHGKAKPNPAKRKNPPTGERVTIYFTGPMGNIGSKEGSLAGVDAHGVEFIPKGGRREHRIMTYYSPFIMVVRGWGKAKPSSGFGPASVGANGVTTRRGLYRSHDPRWVSDFMRDIGGRFHPIAMFENGQLVSGGE